MKLCSRNLDRNDDFNFGIWENSTTLQDFKLGRAVRRIEKIKQTGNVIPEITGECVFWHEEIKRKA